MFVDSHCHLDFPGLAEREDEILATMAANDVGAALCISVQLEEFPRVRALAAWSSCSGGRETPGSESYDSNSSHAAASDFAVEPATPTPTT